MKIHDVDLSRFFFAGDEVEALADLRSLSDTDKEQLLTVGMDAEERERVGSFLHMNYANLHCASHQKGLEIIDIKRALKQYNGLPEYYWKLVSPDQDVYTRSLDKRLHGGYFIRTKKGVKIEKPVQACLFISNQMVGQSVHNIVVVEEDSVLNIISGCAVARGVEQAAHIGISEFYVKKNAKLTFTMIHNWGKATAVRPRSAGVVEEGGVFLNNYVLMKPVKDLQMYPSLSLNGSGAVARFNSIVVAFYDSCVDTGSRILLNAPNTRGEIVARSLTLGGTIISRGHVAGRAVPCRGHLMCKGLIVGSGGLIHAVPELEGALPGVELSHEAAVGKIAQEEIEYLMARGLDKDEAISTVVRGFLDVDIMGLSKELKLTINETISEFEQELF